MQLNLFLKYFFMNLNLFVTFENKKKERSSKQESTNSSENNPDDSTTANSGGLQYRTESVGRPPYIVCFI